MQSNEFELPSCAENMKEKSIDVELSRSLVSDFETSTNENLETSLQVMNSTIPTTLNSSLDEFEQSKDGESFMLKFLILESRNSVLPGLYLIR